MKKDNNTEIMELGHKAKKILFQIRGIARKKDKDLVPSFQAIDEILEIARITTAWLQLDCIDDDGIKNWPHLRFYLNERVMFADSFPINYNEMLDLLPYKKLKIGYGLTRSKNPKKRFGSSPFSQYAETIYLTLKEQVVEQRAILKGGEALSEFKESKRMRSEMYANEEYSRILLRGLSEEDLVFRTRFERIFLSFNSDDLKPLAYLCEPKDWAEAAKVFFKAAFPKCEEIKSLAAAIGDGEVKYESQIRARIVERIGRAVRVLAQEGEDVVASRVPQVSQD